MTSVTRMTSVTIPRIASSDPRALFSSMTKVLAGTLGLAFLISCAAAIIVPPLIPFVYGAAFREAAPVFIVLLVPNLLSSAHVLSVPLLRLFKRVWIMSLTNLAGMGIAIACYFFLLRVLPAIWSMCLSVTIFQLFSMILFVFVAMMLRESRRGAMYHPR
jgi:O-antigen/teichoic acid export membrane protein